MNPTSTSINRQNCEQPDRGALPNIDSAANLKPHCAVLSDFSNFLRNSFDNKAEVYIDALEKAQIDFQKHDTSLLRFINSRNFPFRSVIFQQIPASIKNHTKITPIFLLAIKKMAGYIQTGNLNKNFFTETNPQDKNFFEIITNIKSCDKSWFSVFRSLSEFALISNQSGKSYEPLQIIFFNKEKLDEFINDYHDFSNKYLTENIQRELSTLPASIRQFLSLQKIKENSFDDVDNLHIHNVDQNTNISFFQDQLPAFIAHFNGQKKQSKHYVDLLINIDGQLKTINRNLWSIIIHKDFPQDANYHKLIKFFKKFEIEIKDPIFYLAVAKFFLYTKPRNSSKTRTTLKLPLQINKNDKKFLESLMADSDETYQKNKIKLNDPVKILHRMSEFCIFYNLQKHEEYSLEEIIKNPEEFRLFLKSFFSFNVKNVDSIVRIQPSTIQKKLFLFCKNLEN